MTNPNPIPVPGPWGTAIPLPPLGLTLMQQLRRTGRHIPLFLPVDRPAGHCVEDARYRGGLRRDQSDGATLPSTLCLAWSKTSVAVDPCAVAMDIGDAAALPVSAEVLPGVRRRTMPGSHITPGTARRGVSASAAGLRLFR